MKRIYSNYSEEDFEIVRQMAEELGFSLSSFQHYCVMLYADSRGNTTELSRLVEQMNENMQQMKPRDTFIVSALLPEKWPSLSRGEKMTLAKQLSASVKRDPNFSVYKATKGKPTVYVRVS